MIASPLFDRAYSVRGTSDADADGLTFADALERLRASRDRYADAAHVRRDGRHVAFFSSWPGYERSLRVMWQATDVERSEIEAWHG